MEKSLWQRKTKCHQLLDTIWGTANGDKAQAYAWLNREFGRTIHFKEINDEKVLKDIEDRLTVFSVFGNTPKQMAYDVNKDYVFGSRWRDKATRRFRHSRKYGRG